MSDALHFADGVLEVGGIAALVGFVDFAEFGSGVHGVLLFVDGSNVWQRIEPATPQQKNVMNR